MQHGDVLEFQSTAFKLADPAFEYHTPVFQRAAIAVEVRRVAVEHAFDIAAGLGTFPGVEKCVESLASRLHTVGHHPLQLRRDHHRCGAASFHGLHHTHQIRIGQHYTTIGVERWPRVARHWRAVQPDASAGLAALAVEHVRVVDRQGTGTVKVAERFGTEGASDEVHAERRARVAFDIFLQPGLADGTVEVGNQSHPARSVFKQIEPRLGAIDGDRVPGFG